MAIHGDRPTQRKTNNVTRFVDHNEDNLYSFPLEGNGNTMLNTRDHEDDSLYEIQLEGTAENSSGFIVERAMNHSYLEPVDGLAEQNFEVTTADFIVPGYVMDAGAGHGGGAKFDGDRSKDCRSMISFCIVLVFYRCV
jgi:hypothetical protein